MRLQLKKIISTAKFNDFKIRFLSSLILIIFACIFFFFCDFLYSSVVLVFIYSILIYEWHIACLKKKTFFDFFVFLFISFGMFAFSFMNMLRFQQQDNFIIPIIWIVATAIFTDTGAYFTGRMIGGYRPFPVISPAKTLSGYIGGGILGGSVPLVTGFLFQEKTMSIRQIMYLLLIGIVLSIAVMAGDLLQSYFKRKNNIKDTGKIIPGHGGLFDRFDGILGASCVLLCVWCIQMMGVL